MTVITLDTAAALDALGAEICDAHYDVVQNKYVGDVMMTAPSTDMDTRLANLIAPIMQEIDGRTLATGFKYTLNVTNAFQLRPKKWFLHGLYEYDGASKWPAEAEIAYMPWNNGGVYGGVTAYGSSVGLAMCCGICKAWAGAVRMASQGNYPPPVISLATSVNG